VEAKVQKWGNSLAVRIPKPYAAELGLQEHAQVALRVSEGAIVITPVTHRTYRLEELLAGVRRSNLHAEIDTGRPRGDEVW
jgi:antitoxin MazE